MYSSRELKYNLKPVRPIESRLIPVVSWNYNNNSKTLKCLVIFQWPIRHSTARSIDLSSNELNKQISENQKDKPHPVKKVTCPHCGKIGGGGAMKQFHFNKCEKITGVKIKRSESFKQKIRVPKSEAHKKNMRKSKSPSHIMKMKKPYTCPYCLKEGTGNAMKQWHFDNCKHKY